MEPITSTDNSHVKLVRSLLESKGRRQQRAFIVEGVRLVEASLERALPQLVFHTESFPDSSARARALLVSLAETGAPIRAVTERVLAHVTDTVTPQGIVAVLPLPDQEAKERSGAALDLLLDEVGDPGNAGTLLRTAAAAGVTRVIAGPGTVDLYAPKVVRAGAGAHFSLPLATVESWESAVSAVPPNVTVYLADAHSPMHHWDVDWTRPSALIVGNEARGASSGARRLAAQAISIPMAARVESLNAAIAGSIIMYEALRQRTAAGGIR